MEENVNKGNGDPPNKLKSEILDALKEMKEEQNQKLEKLSRDLKEAVASEAYERLNQDFEDWMSVKQEFLATVKNYNAQLAAAQDVKFTQPLAEPLAIGTLIVFTGTPADDIPGFALDMGCGHADWEHADIAARFNVRMPQRCVARNSRAAGRWGHEDTSGPRIHPFKVGHQFTIQVLVEESKSAWTVNGTHYCDYAHRTPSLFSADWVQARGVRDAMITIQKCDTADLGPCLSPFSELERRLAEARNVKFTEILTEPLKIGTRIVLTGTPKDIPWFTLNIGCGYEQADNANIAAHFNVRMPQTYVVRNTREHGQWGPEETSESRLFPFKVGRPFRIEVLVEKENTAWTVDGEHYCDYSHRAPSPLDASWVQVRGVRDAQLTIQRKGVKNKVYTKKQKRLLKKFKACFS